MAEEAVVGDAVPVADNEIAAGIGDAAAEAAVAALNVAVVGGAALIDSGDEKSENGAAVMERGEPEAAEAAGAAAEPSPLVAATGCRTHRTHLALTALILERIWKWSCIVYMIEK